MSDATVGFKEFVDNYVQTTTKFKSAEDLLKNGKPLMFVWILIGIPALIGLVAIFPIGIVIGALLGYAVAFVVGIIRRVKLYGKVNYIDADVDLDQLVPFLNDNLQYLSPYFGKWERLKDDGVFCNFNGNKINAVMYFETGAKSGKKFFSISARKASVMGYIVISGSSLSAGNTNAGFGEYRCAYLAAPILQATMEYYLKRIGA